MFLILVDLLGPKGGEGGAALPCGGGTFSSGSDITGGSWGGSPSSFCQLCGILETVIHRKYNALNKISDLIKTKPPVPGALPRYVIILDLGASLFALISVGIKT